MDWTAMGLWVDSWQRQQILLLQSTQTPTQVLSPVVVWPWCQDDHSPPSTIENVWDYSIGCMNKHLWMQGAIPPLLQEEEEEEKEGEGEEQEEEEKEEEKKKKEEEEKKEKQKKKEKKKKEEEEEEEKKKT